jgi:hypothetical protein
MTLPTKAKANPTKAFFVRMVTRDISLEDCILDLTDNSVDGAWQMEGGRVMSLSSKTDLSKYKIEIEASADQFQISDNCGGITLDEAAEYAFTFGRRDTDPHEKYSIGVYGIGMKRAIFKIGNDIRIRSTYKPKSGRAESFAVPIKVATWLGNDDQWDFDIEPDEPLPAAGVKITISTLNDGAATSFGNPAFIQRLKRTIARDYALHLHRGLTITLNGDTIKGWEIELREGKHFEPLRVAYTDEEEDLPVVNVELLAGMAASPPETSEPDESDQEEDRSGWYAACNGRIVLAADKSSVAGWGTDDWPKWHPQYSGFIGIILFVSEDAARLPLTTTKRSVDTSSSVYRRALPRMREASKQWIAYTNVRKQALEQAKRFEAAAKPLSIFEVKRSPAVSLPSLRAKPKVQAANIAYSMPRERVRELADEFGNINMSYREVGINSFDYAYSNLVGEAD